MKVEPRFVDELRSIAGDGGEADRIRIMLRQRDVGFRSVYEHDPAAQRNEAMGARSPSLALAEQATVKTGAA